MGFFNTLASLLDENSGDSFEQKITQAIDRVEDSLNKTLDTAEAGVKKASESFNRLEAGADKLAAQAETGSKKALRTIDVIDKKVSKS